MENINLDNLATKDGLKSEIRRMIEDKMATKDDIKVIREEMATNIDLKDAKDGISRTNKLVLSLDAKIDNVKDELKSEIQEKFDKILDGADKQIKILEELRFESAAHTASYKRHDEKIDQHEEVLNDYEERIKVLELKPTI